MSTVPGCLVQGELALQCSADPPPSQHNAELLLLHSATPADAHEFSYMIDQPTEAKRFDPDGRYVRRWLPVLARLPAQWIHQPWLAPENVLADAGGWRAGGQRGVGRG